MRRGKSLLLLMTVLGLGLLAMEWGVRLILPQQVVRDYVLPDPDLGTSLRPSTRYHDLYGNNYWIVTNRHGFRMDEEVRMDPAVRRVMLYGDSFTFGLGVNAEFSYAALLKGRADRADLQLVNAGVGGYSTGHVTKLVRRHLPQFSPDRMIYFFNNNDIFDNYITDIDYRVTAYQERPDGGFDLSDAQPFSPAKRFLMNYTPYGWLNRNSHLFVLGKDLLKRGLDWKQSVAVSDEVRQISGVPPSPAAGGSLNAPTFTVSDQQAQEARQHARRMVALSVAHLQRLAQAAQGKTMLIVWVPAWEEMFTPDADSPKLAMFTAMRAALAAFCADTPGFAFLDTTVLIPRGAAWQARQDDFHFAGDGHFNKEGNRWFADLVAPRILEFVR